MSEAEAPPIKVDYEGIDAKTVRIRVKRSGRTINGTVKIDGTGNMSFMWDMSHSAEESLFIIATISILESGRMLDDDRILAEAAKAGSTERPRPVVEAHLMSNLFRVTSETAWRILVDKLVTEGGTDELRKEHEGEAWVGVTGWGNPYFDSEVEGKDTVEEFMLRLAKIVHPDDTAVVTVVQHKGGSDVSATVYVAGKGRVTSTLLPLGHSIEVKETIEDNG